MSFDFRVVSHVLSSPLYEKPWQTRTLLCRLLGQGPCNRTHTAHRTTDFDYNARYLWNSRRRASKSSKMIFIYSWRFSYIKNISAKTDSPGIHNTCCEIDGTRILPKGWRTSWSLGGTHIPLIFAVYYWCLPLDFSSSIWRDWASSVWLYIPCSPRRDGRSIYCVSENVQSRR